MKVRAPRRLPNLEGDGDRSAGDGAPELGGDPASSGGAGPGADRRANRAARPVERRLPKRVGDDPPELGGDASPGSGGAGAGCTRAAGAGRGSPDAIRPAAPRLLRPADRRGDGRPWPGLPSGILLASLCEQQTGGCVSSLFHDANVAVVHRRARHRSPAREAADNCPALAPLSRRFAIPAFAILELVEGSMLVVDCGDVSLEQWLIPSALRSASSVRAANAP